MRDKSVSVVIPVRNEAARISKCIDAILSQTIPVKEIIVVDSGSTDDTLEILSHYARVRVLEIPHEEFDHGETRNVGVRAASSEFVLFTVGDARAVDTRWIEELLHGFTDDEVVAVCGSQVVPHSHTANPAEWSRPLDEPQMRRVQFEGAETFEKLTPAEKLDACGWDDVSALYRREVLMKIPFDRASYGEDAVWVQKALRAGHAVTYNPAAKVYHYHVETPEFSFKRAIAAMFVRYRYFGYLYEDKGIAIPFARIARRVAMEPSLSWQERVHWLRYNWRNQSASRDAVRAFREAVRTSPDAVDELHRLHCSVAPIPLKDHSVRS